MNMFEKMADITIDLSVEQVKEWMKDGQAQKILLSCFENYQDEEKKNGQRESDCYINKDMILNVDDKKISPNLYPEQIRENLSSIFGECIRTDDMDKKCSIENRICYDYVAQAKKKLMELYHLDEDIHSVKDEVLKSREISVEQHTQVIRELKSLVSKDNKIEKANSKKDFVWLWEPEEAIVNTECIKIISEYPKEWNIFESTISKGQDIEGVDALNLHIWKFMHTERYRYKIYSEKYGTEYTEFLKTKDEKTFIRLAPLVANELLEYENFREWIAVIYGFRKEENKLFLDYGVKGNQGKIISINLLWNNDGSDIGGLQVQETDNSNSQNNNNSNVEETDIDSFDVPTAFFDYRFGKAFPGVRGIREFINPSECINRLEILLRNPLNKKKRNMVDPIWWLRGSSNNEIVKFEKIDDRHILMNEKELEIKRVIAYASSTYYKKFVYVETNPEQATGLYDEVTEEQMQYWVNAIGAYFEEYAVFDGHLITRAEYDDGAAIINGKVVDTERKAEVRIRYLTPYNFIICAKWNPLNQTKVDSMAEKVLYGMINGTHTINDLVSLCEKLPRHRMDM